MPLRPLALLALLSAPALAQDPAAAAPAPAATAPAEPPPAAPRPAADQAPVTPRPEAAQAPAPTPPKPTAAQAPAPPKPAAAQAPAPPKPTAQQAPAPSATPPPRAALPASGAPAPTPQPRLPETQLPVDDTSPEAITRTVIQQEARFLFQSLLTGDVRSAAAELTYPFQLEDKRFNTPEELVQAWVKQLRARRTDLITLYDIEVLPMSELEKKYGKPPARLGLDPRALKDTWAAVGNLSGHAAVLLFRQGADVSFRAFAYTD